MKKKLLIGILSLVFVFLVGLTTTQAQNFKSGEQASASLKSYLHTSNGMSKSMTVATVDYYKFLFAKTVLTEIKKGESVSDSFEGAHRKFVAKMDAVGADLNAIEQDILAVISN